MTEKDQLFHLVAQRICGKRLGITAQDCLEEQNAGNSLCSGSTTCRIYEKTEEQLAYVVHPLLQHTFLSACPGSGKTEVVGLKAAYEIKEWSEPNGGIAILAFTNNATSVIKERVAQFVGSSGTSYPHFIGTIDSWLLSFFANPFAHLITQYSGQVGDRSIRLVSRESSAGFLNNFKTKYGLGGTGNVLANQYYFDHENDCWVFASSNRALDETRNNIDLEDWQRNDLSHNKKAFWRRGFATFQDIENLSYQLLRRDEFAERFAQRFPIIIVDECQDLSWIQVQILDRLRRGGSKLHLIGDLDQSIYAFKRVDPDKVRNFKNSFVETELQLNENFRSVQPVVDLCNKLIGKNINTQGRSYCSDLPACILFIYNDSTISELPRKFINYVEDRGYDAMNCAILARGSSTINRLRSTLSSSTNELDSCLALAIFLWGDGDLAYGKEAIELIGKFVARKYFDCPLDSRNQYCPNTVSSALNWRQFLAKILDDCQNRSQLSNLEQRWSDWARVVRDQFPKIMEKQITDNDIPIDSYTFQFRSPRGTATQIVRSTLRESDSEENSAGIRITTFHQVKGETLDAVLVVSAPDRRSQGGHWEHWLDADRENEEHVRFAYVASSRPRQVLAWAIPEDTKTDYTIFGNLGFDLGGIET